MRTSVVAAVRCYVRNVADAFRRRQLCPSETRPESPDAIAGAVFAVLAQREFTYLSKARVGVYRASILGQLARDVNAGRSLRFYYDIGGGYRAGTDGSRRELSFSPGLGELLALRQITLFDRQIRAVYPPGTKFWLVVDNMCARLVNDIPLHRTSSYCEELRSMIRQLGLEGGVDLLVESEHFSLEDYSVDTSGAAAGVPSPAAVENVARFLGRDCEVAEAMERIALYRAVSDETERKLQSRVDGVRMTQRATASTFGFRSFPGGDSRMQSGDVILACRDSERVEPRLVTSQSPLAASVRFIDVSDLLPLPGREVGYVVVSE